MKTKALGFVCSLALATLTLLPAIAGDKAKSDNCCPVKKECCLEKAAKADCCKNGQAKSADKKVKKAKKKTTASAGHEACCAAGASCCSAGKDCCG